MKNPSEDVFMNAVRSAAANGRKVVVAGCVPQGDRKSKALAAYSVVGVQQIDRVVEVVEQTMQVCVLSYKPVEALGICSMYSVAKWRTSRETRCVYYPARRAVAVLDSISPRSGATHSLRSCLSTKGSLSISASSPYSSYTIL